MNQISSDCRREGLTQALPHIGPLQGSILDCLRINPEKTCREVMSLCGSDDLNNYRSRMCELTKAGLIEVTGTKLEGRVRNGVYRVVNRGQGDFFK